MAIGGIQNRFDAGAQRNAPQNVANADRSAVPQIQRRNNENQRNVINPAENNEPENVRTAAANVQGGQRNNQLRQNNITGQDVIDLENRAQTGQDQIVKRAQSNRTGGNNVIRRIEEDALFNNNTAGINNEVQRAENNPANRGVERTEQAQLQQIENTNAAAANIAQPEIINNAALSQENQLGTRFDAQV